MASPFEVDDMFEALRQRLRPTVTVWNRLEGRPRRTQFDRALRAEVRDALWMLTRQWQLGEFRGDDAGSPVLARLNLATTRLTKYRAREAASEPFEEGTPLEATVERRPVSLERGGREIALDLRLLMGRQWLKMIAGIGDLRAAFTNHYPVELPAAPDPPGAERFAHPEVWQTFAAAQGRLMDGGGLYLHLRGDPGNHAYDGMSAVDDADRAALDAQAERFVQWFERLFLQPADDESAWVPERLEYRFACSAPEEHGERVFIAEEYAQGRLDWYSLDSDADSAGLGDTTGAPAGDLPESMTQTLMPTPVQFDGMPNTRWWAFEDGRTSFGSIEASTTDLAKLLFVEFALVYANDWFTIPCTLPTGTNAHVRGLAVTTVFGERFWIGAAGAGAEDDWQRWSMFTSSTVGAPGGLADTGLLLLPTVPKVQEGDPLEEVVLIRDEMANMVWGVERVVTLASGHSRPGSEAADETRRFFEGLTGGPPPASSEEPRGRARYQVMTSVPENWIPFVPARAEGATREIQLQRGGMPRILEGSREPPAKVEPRTSLLREGLDRMPREPYFLHEEEVPRSGVHVAQAFQRARGRDGRVVVWLGAHKRVAHGEGSSGLAFDQLIDVPPEA